MAGPRKKKAKRLTELFPEIEPYRRGKLRVSALHTVYFEECGNPRGKPLVFLHGGPGGGIEPAYRRYFDPRKWRIVLFDQRGCGKSTPHAELRENTTWDIVADIERLRAHLGIERWVVFGGSWGSTLSLAYAQTHPKRCKALVLRGIFLLRKSELKWFYQEGASNIFPDAWERFIAPIPPREARRHDARLLQAPDQQEPSCPVARRRAPGRSGRRARSSSKRIRSSSAISDVPATRTRSRASRRTTS
jgi:proline iminopeptidase